MANNQFGFAMKYPTKAGGQVYNLGTDPNNDNRFDSNQTVINNGDGTFRLKDDDDGRINILTSALFNENEIVDDHGELDIDEGGRGYMMAHTDWRDVEIDIALFLHDYSDEDGLTFITGGGRHVNPQPFCEGSAYRVKFYYHGDLEFLKEQWHNNKIPHPDGILKSKFTNMRNRWMHIKICRYNVKKNDGTSAVKIEVYLNNNGDKQTYDLIASIQDNGGWGTSGDECNGKKDQILNWAYPITIIDWSNADRIDWNSICVREIQPQGAIPEDPDNDGQPVPPEAPTGYVQKVLSFRFSMASILATSCDGVDEDEPPQDPVPPNPPDGGAPPGGGRITQKLREYWKVL